MPIAIEEAARIARAYGMSFTDMETLIRLTADGTYEDALHLAVEFAGSNEERAGQAFVDERKKQDADQAAENKAMDAYQAKQAKPKKPERVQVQPEYRDGMSDNDRVREMNRAHELNVKAAADERAAEVKQTSLDYYNWTASDDYRNFKDSLQGGD